MGIGDELDVRVDNPTPRVRRVTFNRPKSLNALTFQMVEVLISELENLRFDLGTSVLILTGEGRGFCAGADRNNHDPPWIRHELGQVQLGVLTLRRISEIGPLLRSLPQAVIASVNGVTAGLGLNLVLSSDIALAGASAVFVNGFHNVGGIGGEAGLSYLLARAVGAQRAAEILLTNRRLSATEAAEMGLITRVVADDELESESLALAAEILKLAPIAIANTKSTLWSSTQVLDLRTAIDMETNAQLLVLQTDDAAAKREAISKSQDPVFRNM